MVKSQVKNEIKQQKNGPQRPQPDSAQIGTSLQSQPGTLPEIQYALADPRAATPTTILKLQRQAGNRAVTQLIQAKLAVGPADDKYEQEADHIAAQVMTIPAPAAEGTGPVQRQAGKEKVVQAQPLVATITPLAQREPTSGEEEEEVQAKPLVQRQPEEEEEEVQAKAAGPNAAAGFEVSKGLEQRLTASKGGGSPLPAEVCGFMEPRFGADFSGVRVHTDSAAAEMSQQIQAKAFTLGQDIYMGAGQYAPESDAGKRLLAHELTHTIQQAGNTIQRKLNPVAAKDTGWSSEELSLIDTINEGIKAYSKIEVSDYDARLESLDALLEDVGVWLDDHSELSETGFSETESMSKTEEAQGYVFNQFEELAGDIENEKEAVLKAQAQSIDLQEAHENLGESQEAMDTITGGKLGDLSDTVKDQVNVEVPGAFSNVMTGIKGTMETVKDKAQGVAVDVLANVGWLGFLEKLANVLGMIPFGAFKDFAVAVKGFFDARKVLAGLKGTTKTATAPELVKAAAYGVSKVTRRYWSKIYDMVTSLIKLITDILSLFTGPMVGSVTAAISLGISIIGAILTLARKAKGLWKWLQGTRGVNRRKNAEVLVDYALNDDQDSLAALKQFGLAKKVDQVKSSPKETKGKIRGELIKAVFEKLASQ